mgnify:CR=1 FL=1
MLPFLMLFSHEKLPNFQRGDRRDDGHALRKALEFKVKGKRKRGPSRKTWKMQVEKESRSVGLKKEYVLNRTRWRVGIREIAARVG